MKNVYINYLRYWKYKEIRLWIKLYMCIGFLKDLIWVVLEEEIYFKEVKKYGF